MTDLISNENSTMLDGLENDAVVDFISASEHRAFRSGETIIDQGDKGDQLFYIVAGRVRVSAGEGSNQRTVAVLGPGDLFGEAAVLSGEGRAATVEAAMFTETLTLSCEKYEQLAVKHPSFQKNVCRVLARRQAQSVKARSNSGSHSPTSLAVVIEHPAGWGLAQSISDRLRGWRQQAKPLLVGQSSKEASNQALLSPWAGCWCDGVAADELHLHVSSRAAAGMPIVIATDPHAAEAALRECERVLFVTDGESAGSWAKQLASDHASECVVARVFSRPERLTPFQNSENARELRLQLAETGLLNSDAVTRTVRAVQGRRIGIALGGGGARGIAHIGVLEVLTQHGFIFDEIAGTSAGAIIGAAYAAGLSMGAVAEMFRSDFMPPRWLSGNRLGRRLFLMGAFRGNRLETIFRKHLGSAQFEQLELPFSITAVDLISGERVIRDRGDVVRAILESINHPAFGRPILTSSQALVDGGVLVNVPTSLLADSCDQVVSVDVGSALSDNYARDKNGKLKAPAYIATILRAIDVTKKYTNRQHRDFSDAVISPQASRFRLEDFHEIDALIEIGRQAALESLDDVRAIVDNV